MRIIFNESALEIVPASIIVPAHEIAYLGKASERLRRSMLVLVGYIFQKNILGLRGLVFHEQMPAFGVRSRWKPWDVKNKH